MSGPQVTVTERLVRAGFLAEPEEHLWIKVESGSREDRWRVAEAARAAAGMDERPQEKTPPDELR